MNEPDRQRWLHHPHVRTAAAQVRRHRVWLYALAGLFVLFGLLGYFWLPGYAKGKLEEALSAKLHRPVTVERIEINPYTLEATVRGFRIGETSGSGALFKFDSLYVNLSSMSIARAAPVVSAVTLSGPVLHLARDAEGRLSIADLIEAFSQQPASEGETHFSVSNIRVENGSFEFDDALKHTKQRVSEINLGLPFVANFDSSEEVWVQPHLSARINDGSLIDLQGRARPFADKREAVLDVKLDGLDLTDLVAYAPLGGMQLHAGRFDAQLEIGFSKDEQQAAAIRIDGTLGLRDADLESRAGLPWRLRGQRLAVHLQRFDPMLKHPIDAALEATQLHFRQGDKPEMNIDSLRVDDVHADLAAHTARFALNAGINGKGKLDAKGSVGWAPLTADLAIKADQVDLVALQGFAIEHPFVVATKGALSFDGSVKAAGTPLNVAVKGDARVSDLNLLDKTNNDDLLRWRSLDVAGIDVNTAPLDVKIHSITGSDFFARVTIMPDGTLR
ncbi:MAG TPA: DUF748 domain-containing protein, partial [Rhodocyclaceae bacterium]|nr:DUF748 domain-containing protein [Rhodocyclaceae bacterium]